MKQKLFCIFLFFLSLSLFATEQNYRLGMGERWKDCDFYNVEKETGKKGYVNLRLKNQEYSWTKQTDLLIHFLPKFDGVAKNYELIQACEVKREPKAIGGACGSFSAINPSLKIRPKKNSFLAPGKVVGDFTIEFRIAPNSLTQRENLFFWNNVSIIDENLVHQEISCVIKNRKLEWSFINFFGNEEKKPITVRMQSLSDLVPGEWSHQLISYDSKSGKMMLMMNGKIENIAYITSTGDQNGSLQLARVGENPIAVIEIGRLFSGLLDEIRVEKTAVSEPNINAYNKNRGIVLTNVIDLGFTHSLLDGISADMISMSDSQLFYYYRITDNRELKIQWEEDRAENYAVGEIPHQWIPFNPAQSFETKDNGRYVQIMVEFYTNGTKSETSLLRSMAVHYIQDRPPIPPMGLVAIPLDGGIDLYWDPVADSDLAGYLVYWGEDSGIYFGDGREQSSPIDVGNTNHYRIEKLDNGKLYFFSIVAYDKSWGKRENDDNHKSDFSTEVSARPARIYGIGED